MVATGNRLGTSTEKNLSNRKSPRRNTNKNNKEKKDNEETEKRSNEGNEIEIDEKR